MQAAGGRSDCTVEPDAGPSTQVTVAAGVGAAGCEAVSKSRTRSAVVGTNDGLVLRATWKWIGSEAGWGMFDPPVEAAPAQAIVVTALEVGATHVRVTWLLCAVVAESAAGGLGFVPFCGRIHHWLLAGPSPLSVMATIWKT